MRNIQNIDISLKEIVKNISNSNYLIPKFQRDFVWNTKDISDLGDSIIRGYPISSLLTMPENGTLKVGASDLVKDDFIVSLPNEENETKNYILDGQQRMTSISKLDDSFCRSFPFGKSNDEKPTRGNNRFISGKAIINDKSGSIINQNF